jgi:streptomycin 6-kinase
MLRQIELTLGIRIYEPFTNLSFSFVAPCVLWNGEEAVFKCCVPNKELTAEIAALKYFNGDGCVKLIDSDLNVGWIIMERLYPGELLSAVKDDETATRTFIKVMQKLHKPINRNQKFPTVETLLKGFERLRREFNGATGPFPKELVCYAEKLAKQLLQSSDLRVLLHGDLHHYNILSSNRDDWLAIDPKGVIGEPEYEMGAFMQNPIPKLMYLEDLEKVFTRRIDIIVEMTGFDRQRLLAWSFVKTMLSAWWCYEDRCANIKTWLLFAEILKNSIR